jgi:aryl-alcohol dehydrogenase-like predicted oxidoreductase
VANLAPESLSDPRRSEVDKLSACCYSEMDMLSGWKGVSMEYRPLGRTGVSVSHLCLGAMMFGAFGNPDHDDSVQIIHKALDAGINFIDTADGYSAGESEEIIGKALTDGRRENVVLAVKFGVPFGDDDPNHRGASRRWITDAVEGSLRRLRTDWIDLYQVGVPDRATDVDETLGALSDLVTAGKIRSFGTSKLPASEIVEAQWVAERRGHGRFRSEQPPYNILTRAVEYDLLPTCQRHGIGVMAYSPLAGGWLSGKYRKGQEVSGPGSAARQRRFPALYDAASPANAAKLDAADALGRLADEAGITLIQMAVAFATRHPAVTSAIIGPRTLEHLEGYLAADGTELPADVLDRIDEIVPPGVTINVVDNMWNIGTPALGAANRRR